MQLALKHAQAVEQLIAAIQSVEVDSTTVAEIVLDPSIPDYEAIFITAKASAYRGLNCHALANAIDAENIEHWHQREAMVRQITARGDLDGVIKSLGELPRQKACCLVALICDWSEPSAAKIAEKMEYLHANPEKLGV